MIALTVAITFGAIMAVNPDARAAVIRWFTETFMTHDAYRFTNEPAEQTGGRWYPAYLPEGYVEVEYTDMFGYVSIVYENKAGERIYVDCQPLEDGGGFQIDNEQMEITETRLGSAIVTNYQSTVEDKKNAVLLIDEERDISFRLVAFESCETLIRIAESMEFSG